MLYDELQKIGRYRGLYKGLDVFIQWLDGHTLDELPLGRTEILGSKVFVNVMEAQPRPVEGAEYEFHQNYMDLQLDLAGTERFLVPGGPLTVTLPLDAEKDIGFGIAKEGCGGRLDGGRFALFLAEEPHMPTLQAGCPMVKKAVVKILRDELF